MTRKSLGLILNLVHAFHMGVHIEDTDPQELMDAASVLETESALEAFVKHDQAQNEHAVVLYDAATVYRLFAGAVTGDSPRMLKQARDALLLFASLEAGPIKL